MPAEHVHFDFFDKKYFFSCFPAFLTNRRPTLSHQTFQSRLIAGGARRAPNMRKAKTHLLLHSPIVNIIERVAVHLKHLPQQLAAVVVIGRLVEFEVSAIAQERSKLGRQPLTQLTNRDVLLLEADLVVLVLLIGCLQTLPRQLTAKKV